MYAYSTLSRSPGFLDYSMSVEQKSVKMIKSIKSMAGAFGSKQNSKTLDVTDLSSIGISVQHRNNTVPCMMSLHSICHCTSQALE